MTKFYFLIGFLKLLLIFYANPSQQLMEIVCFEVCIMLIRHQNIFPHNETWGTFMEKVFTQI